MSSLGDYLRRAGIPVGSDNPVYGRPAWLMWWRPEFIVVHHFVGSESTAAIDEQVRFLKYGKDFPPNSQLYLDVLGSTHVISKQRWGQKEPGRATHMGEGTYPGIARDQGNTRCVGIECQNTGYHPIGDNPTQYRALIRLIVALLRRYNLGWDRVIGHKEYNPGKVDPIDSMDKIRADVKAEMDVKPEQRAGTWNLPRRLGAQWQAKDLQHATRTHEVLLWGVQEVGDSDHKALLPDGWDWWRPEKARSSTLMFSHQGWTPTYWPVTGKRRQGTFKVSRKDDRPRYIVWARLRNEVTGKIEKVGVVHLPAFKTRGDVHAARFRHAERRAAKWLGRPGRRILLGDLNANRGGWTPNLRRFVWEEPTDNATGPGGTHIDHVLRNSGPRPQVVATVQGVSDHDGLIVRL